MQFSKFAAQCFVLIKRQFLVSKEQYLMRHPGLVQFIELLIANRCRQIHTAHDRADVRAQRLDAQSLLAHRLVPWQAARAEQSL